MTVFPTKLENVSVVTGGRARVTLVGAASDIGSVDQLCFIVQRGDPAAPYLMPGRWGASEHRFTSTDVVVGTNDVTFEVGPDIVDIIDEYTTVRFQLADYDVAGQVAWSGVTPTVAQSGVGPLVDHRAEQERKDRQARELAEAEARRKQAEAAAEAQRIAEEKAREEAEQRARIAEEEAALLSVPVAALDRAMVELGEAQRGVAEALEALDFDPGRLDAVEERLFAIRALARKHQVAPDALADLATDMTQRLDEIDGGAEHIAALEIAAGEARRAYDAAASRVSEARRTAAETLDQAIGEELAPLRMEKAVFRTEITAGTPGPEGTDAVRFTAATNPGTPPGPIDRIASGGELSRFLLAMKVCLAGRAEGLTMIFDEIDRGVGGATAAAVGRRLGKLAEDAQVLVVTHSPQVAAEGAHHWHIAKTSEQEATRTEVRALAEPERLDEIARMLAGEHVTEEARSAARALMQQAGT